MLGLRLEFEGCGSKLVLLFSILLGQKYKFVLPLIGSINLRKQKIPHVLNLRSRQSQTKEYKILSIQKTLKEEKEDEDEEEKVREIFFDLRDKRRAEPFTSFTSVTKLLSG